MKDASWCTRSQQQLSEIGDVRKIGPSLKKRERETNETRLPTEATVVNTADETQV
jgi:hypothetical protein